MLKLSVKNAILLLAAVIAVTAAGFLFFINADKSIKPEEQTLLASIFNSREVYDELFSGLKTPQGKIKSRAGIVPHHFLAKDIIASFFNQVSSDSASTVFVISPDHFNKYFEQGKSAFTSRLDWETPFGQIAADKNLIAALSQNSVSENNSAIALEHGIYVEMPFIKKFFPNAKIVPLILKNGASMEIFYRLGAEIKKLSPQNSFMVISSDFSHDAAYEDAKRNDRKSIKALQGLDLGNIKNITNDCNQCMAMLSGFLEGDNYAFNLLDNKNSYDISSNSENSVTSYVSGYFDEKKYVQLLFTGDLMFDRGIRYYAGKNGGNDFIFEKIGETLKNNDLVIANLEGPITTNKSVSLGSKIGSPNNYYFTFDPSLAETLYKNNIRTVSLANNHILNFGQAGLESTGKYLEGSGVDYFGVQFGKRSQVENIGGVKIAFTNYNQFSGDKNEEEKTLAEIKKIKQEADIVVVFCHWGNEYELQESENQKELGHKFVDAGADLVIGSHPHVIQPVEDYNNKKIYYSLGNFIFDQYFDENVRNGMMVRAKIDKATKQMEFKEIKTYLQPGGQTILPPQ